MPEENLSPLTILDVITILTVFGTDFALMTSALPIMINTEVVRSDCSTQSFPLLDTVQAPLASFLAFGKPDLQRECATTVDITICSGTERFAG